MRGSVAGCGLVFGVRPAVAIASTLLLLPAHLMAAAGSQLADAMEQHDLQSVRTLLKEHADVNAPQADGMSALHWAAYHDDVEFAEQFVKNGANVKAENRYGVTPLFLSCVNGNTAMVELLLEAGADANATVRGGETALMTAARTGRPGPVKALLSGHADANARERRGQTAVMWAAADGHVEVVELLIQAGADFSSPLESGFTPLFFAAREGRTEVVRALLKAGADVNSTMQPRKATGKGARAGTSPLLLAAENGHFELGVVLLEAGADPNDQRSGFTPLHVLTWVRKPNRGDGDDGDPAPQGSGRLDSLHFVRKLVEHGADINTRLENGSSGVGQLSRVGATPFLLAAVTDDATLMRLLVALGADPLLGNADNATPLMAAAGLGTLAPTEEAGTEEEALEAVELALSLGGDVNAVDKNGETAMHGAAYKNLPKVVQLLAEKGARIEVWNQPNRHGWTPLRIAEGYRPGNFKPSTETIAAVHRVMLAAGVVPPQNSAPPATADPNYSTDQAKQGAP